MYVETGLKQVYYSDFSITLYDEFITLYTGNFGVELEIHALDFLLGSSLEFGEQAVHGASLDQGHVHSLVGFTDGAPEVLLGALVQDGVVVVLIDIFVGSLLLRLSGVWLPGVGLNVGNVQPSSGNHPVQSFEERHVAPEIHFRFLADPL